MKNNDLMRTTVFTIFSAAIGFVAQAQQVQVHAVEPTQDIVQRYLYQAKQIQQFYIAKCAATGTYADAMKAASEEITALAADFCLERSAAYNKDSICYTYPVPAGNRSIVIFRPELKPGYKVTNYVPPHMGTGITVTDTALVISPHTAAAKITVVSKLNEDKKKALLQADAKELAKAFLNIGVTLDPCSKQ